MSNFIKLLNTKEDLQGLLKSKFPTLNLTIEPTIDPSTGKYMLQITYFVSKEEDGLKLLAPKDYNGFNLNITKEII